MTSLIVGADSGIGSAIYSKLPGSTGTSRRNGSSHVFLDVLTENWPTFDNKFDEVYYCIAVDGLEGTPEATMQVNALRSVACLDYLAKFVVDGGTIKVLTSIMGSLTKGFMMPATDANVYYRMSKAALNMGVMDLSKRYTNIDWQLVHPGFVNTKITRNLSYIDQAVDPEYAAEKIIALPKIKGVSYIEIEPTGTRMII